MPTSVTNFFRGVVSKKKKRLVDESRVGDAPFNLDLTYITPRIIAMGFPSVGVEASYRNPMHEVQRFFAERQEEEEEDGGGGGGGTPPRRGSKAIGAEPALEDIYEARDDEADDDDEAHDGDAQPTRCDREGYPIDG